jgi:zinc carboxypeptidase
MARRGLVVAIAATVVSATLAAPAAGAERLNSYRALASSASELETLRDQGFDITEGRLRRGIEVVATAGQARKLRAAGLRVRLLRDRRGRNALRAAAAQAQGGWLVWRPYARTDVEVSGAAGNPTDNIKTQLEKLASKHKKIAELQTIGHSLRGVPIYAMKITKDARSKRDGSRPAVLYSSVQHAREWLAGETGRRTLRLFLDNYGRNGTAIGTDGQPVAGVSAKEITKLVDTRELWFILIANPDGYDYTFDPPNRLWRKNLRDNNADGQITPVDGVDLNRNFPTHWNYDDEGSNTDIGSETYRGTGPASEPETRAFDSLVKRVDFAWNKNDHTHGRLLLYPFGWQVDTHAADESVFTALAGDDDNPGIPTFDPDLGAELYTTNGDTNDHLYDRYKTVSFTPEGTSAAQGSGFVFQDVEADVQAEFERHVQFALDLARSGDDQAHPESHLGNEVPMFVVDKFDVSYGDPQRVQTVAHRDLRRVKLHYRINGGRERRAHTREWRGGETYGDKGDYFLRRVRGKVRGADPGDSVKVWFEGKRKHGRSVRSESFTYTVRSDSRADVLVLAAEDYTGNSAFPPYPSTSGPFYLDYYVDALEANGIDADVWDFDAEGRKAPHPLGVLSHYDAVVWYTGNDNVTRATAQPGVAGLEAHQTTMAVRDFMNEGGRLLFTGVHAGRQYDLTEYPQEGLPLSTCDGDLTTTDGGKCQPLSNDFLQYWLGSYVRSDAGGLQEDGSTFPIVGTGDPFAPPFTTTLNGPDSAGNQAGEPVFIGTGTHLVTSSILKPDTYPQFASREVADWQIPGEKPFDPRTGEWYMASQNINQGFKRLTRTITDPRELRFWTSYNTEADWDHLFVEVHNVGQDNWTTLPDANGHTHQTPVGESCESGWHDQLHFRLRHYMSDPAGTGGPCVPTGTTGAWNAASGNSGGWQEWRIDLSAYAGQQIEVSISFATDWATLVVPGVLVDDATVTTGSGSTTTSFETDLGGWVVQGAPPEGPSVNTNEFIRSQKLFEDASITATDDSLFFGFGLEGVDGAAGRADVMRRAMQYLLG